MIEVLKKHPFFTDKHIDSCTLFDNQGYCNENYLVVANGIQYVVRKLVRDDIDRAFEWQVLKLAFDVGITAEPLVFDEVYGLMIFSFLEGVHSQVLDESALKLLAKVLKKLHGIKSNAKPIKLEIRHKTEEVLKAFYTIDQYPKEYALCHNDLNPQNIFFSKDIKLIDFEYAGVNDKYFDLACVCVEFKLDTFKQTQLLDGYFLSTYSIEKLEAYKIIYSTLCKEWFDALG